jgi:gas vesicle protein GvpA/GvpJ/GvpM family
MTAGGMSLPGRARPLADHRQQSASLADVLERVLDNGIVIAGDIRVNLLDIELLTIKIRLLVASVDKAREIGIDWWERDPGLSSVGRNLADENRQLRARIEALEAGRSRPRDRNRTKTSPSARPDDRTRASDA